MFQHQLCQVFYRTWRSKRFRNCVAGEKVLADHNAYGDLIDSIPMVHKDGGTKMMLVINFLSLLQAAFYEREGFCQLILDALKTSPCSIDAPWDLIYYTDEVAPENPLSAETPRKIQMAYLSFLQLGAAASKEESWFCVLAKRSSIVAGRHESSYKKGCGSTSSSTQPVFNK